MADAHIKIERPIDGTHAGKWVVTSHVAEEPVFKLGELDETDDADLIALLEAKVDEAIAAADGDDLVVAQRQVNVVTAQRAEEERQRREIAEAQATIDAAAAKAKP